MQGKWKDARSDAMKFSMNQNNSRLVHGPYQSIDELLSVTSISVLRKVLELPWLPSSERIAELERPQSIRDLLEIRTNSEDLVDDILNRDDTKFTKLLLNNQVVRDWDALSIDLEITSLVDELSDTLQVRLTIRNVWLDEGQHLRSGLCELDEDSIVDLEQSQELHDLSRLRWDLVDTLDSDHKGELGLCWNVEVSILLCCALETNLFPLGFTVLLDVLLSSLEDNLSLLLGCLMPT